MLRRMKALLALICVLALATTSALASDLGLNASNRKIGGNEGVTLKEKNGTLTFGYGKIWMNFDEASFWDAKGDKATAAASTSTDFGDTATITQQWESGDTLQTNLRVATNGTMILTQEAKTETKGISSVSFTLKVPLDYEVIVPAWNGIRLTRGNAVPYMSRMAYPNNWQAQMILIQTTTGGLLVHADDDGSQFKALNIVSDENYFYITIETIPQAPFTQYTSFETVEWNFVPYQGTWQQGAQIYKDYMNNTFGLEEIIAAKPEWAKDIQLVCMMDVVDIPLVTELAKMVDPEKTLLHLVNWRTSNYDVNYPDYSVRAGLKDGVDYAHELGFKVSVHANMLGAHLDNVDYLEHNLADEAVLNSTTLEQVIEGYTAFGQDFAFAQLNQASTVWQDVLIENLHEVIVDVGVDVVHLDQSLLCFNDGRGLMNGMTTMQGNVELQRRLAEAYPNVAFSGEGINEFNARYATYLQMHVYGLDNQLQSWNETWFDQVLPITNFLFEEQINVYHYPGLPTTQEASEKYWQAWYRAGNQRANDITCLYRFNLDEIKNPTLTGKLALWDANFRMENEPVLDTSKWEEDVLLSLKCKDGHIAQWKRDTWGTYFVADASKPEEVSVRFIEGVETAPIDGSIPGWRIYHDGMVMGLDSETSYLVENTPFDPNQTHIAEIEKNLNIRDFEENDDYLAIGIQEIVPSNERTINFLKYDGVMRAGETLDSGVTNATAEFVSANGFDYTMASKAEIRNWGDRVKFHPPWASEGAPVGYAWLEADILLEEYGETVFTASPAMASAANAATSDGVEYKFMAWAKDDPSNVVSTEVYVTSEIGTPIKMDLTQFEGREITVRIECHAGPSTANDSTVLVAPQVVQSRGEREQIITYEIVTAKEAEQVMSISGKAVIETVGEKTYRVECPISDTIYFIYQQAEAEDYIDLACAAGVSVWRMNDGTQKNVPEGQKPVEKVVDAHDDMYNGLTVQPPEDGALCTTYLLTLPEEKASFHAMLLELSGAGKVTFTLRVNETLLAQWEQSGEDAWQEVETSLEAYAGQTILLTMSVEGNGAMGFWGEPYLEVD